MKLLDLIKVEPPRSRAVKDIDEWLARYSKESAFKLADAAGVCPDQIRYWRRIRGLNKPNPFHAPIRASKIAAKKAQRPPRPKIIPNSLDRKQVMNDIELLRSLIEEYTVRELAEMMGYTYGSLMVMLCRRGVRKFDHPCRNKDWLWEHYVEKTMTTEQCAQLAGVYPYTINLWLHKFKIPTRSTREVILIRDSKEAAEETKVGGSAALRFRGTTKGRCYRIPQGTLGRKR